MALFWLTTACLFVTACGATPQAIKDTGHWFGGLLPPPLGTITESLATVVAAFVAYKGGRHVHKRLKAGREARKALEAKKDH